MAGKINKSKARLKTHGPSEVDGVKVYWNLTQICKAISDQTGRPCSRNQYENWERIHDWPSDVVRRLDRGVNEPFTEYDIEKIAKWSLTLRKGGARTGATDVTSENVEEKSLSDQKLYWQVQTEKAKAMKAKGESIPKNEVQEHFVSCWLELQREVEKMIPTMASRCQMMDEEDLEKAARKILKDTFDIVALGWEKKAEVYDVRDERNTLEGV
jgi:hypothetical protein